MCFQICQYPIPTTFTPHNYITKAVKFHNASFTKLFSMPSLSCRAGAVHELAYSIIIEGSQCLRRRSYESSQIEGYT